MRGQPCHQFLLGWLVEINHDVPAENDAEELRAGRLLDQVEASKLDALRYFRFNAIEPFPTAVAPQKVCSQPSRREIFHFCRRVHPAPGLRQSLRGNVGCQNAQCGPASASQGVEHRQGDGVRFCELDMALARRVLAILRELPAERHILLPLANLLRSPHAYVRLTAMTLYGRAANNPEWVRKHLADGDATVRAHAVTCLWGAGTDAASAVLREAARDSDPRVAANALVGLHYDGAADATANLHSMAVRGDSRARAAAAFAMGQTLDAGSKAALQGLLKDRDPKVRSEALQALIRVHRFSSGDHAPTAPRLDTGESVAQ